jgi:AcrR family transcriptional regulator
LYRYLGPVPRSGAQAEGSAGGLHRLPPGRHGLSREFVARNQRDRIIAGTIAAVAEHGFQETTIAQISAAAGVSRRTFYVYFETKEESYETAFGQIVDHLREAAAERASGEDDWPRTVAARLGGVLAVFAANPALAVFTLIVPLRAGGRVAALYRDALETALVELTAGMPAPPEVQPPSEAVQHALIGGVVSMISERVEAGGDVEALAPDLAELFLSPFVGRSAARSAAA